MTISEMVKWLALQNVDGAIADEMTVEIWYIPMRGFLARLCYMRPGKRGSLSPGWDYEQTAELAVERVMREHFQDFPGK